MGIKITAIAKKIIERSVTVENNEAKISIWVSIAKMKAPIVNMMLNSYLEKNRINVIISKKLNQAGITIKERINTIKIAFLGKIFDINDLKVS
jgi:hypothetical protein